MGHPQVQKMAQFPAPREAPGHTEALTVLGAAADDALHAHGAPVHVLVVALRGHEGGEGEGRPEGAERVGWAEDTSPRAAPPPGRARGQQGSPGFALRSEELRAGLQGAAHFSPWQQRVSTRQEKDGLPPCLNVTQAPRSSLLIWTRTWGFGVRPGRVSSFSKNLAT